MKRLPITIILLVLIPWMSFTEQADIVYAEGYVDLKYGDGELVEAFIGDYMDTGDTIITGEDGLAELEKQSGAIIKVAPDTIFMLQELGQDGEKRSVLSTTLGAVRFKFDRLTGKEPVIATPSVVAGVRGTEFQVFAGADGSTLIIVDTGKVAVESQGETVELLPEEGVEVEAGQAPGEKFKAFRGQLDFSTWNSGRLDTLADDPSGTVAGIERAMDAWRENIRELSPRYEANKERLAAERDKLSELEKDKGKDARKEYYEKTVFPLEVETSYMRLNLRYYALSALSFRRFVLGSMYAQVKSAYINRLESDQFTDFIDIYERILAQFEEDVVPLLGEADI